MIGRSTSRTLRLLAPALCACAAAGAFGQGLSLGGSAGAGYSLSTADGDVGTPGTTTAWELLGNLQGSGFISDPRLVRWSAGVDLGQRQSFFFQNRSIMDRLGFNLDGELLSSSVAPVLVRASRQFNDFTTEGGALQSVGVVRTTNYGIEAAYRGNRVPSVRIGLSRVENETQQAGAVIGATAANLLNLTATQSVPALNYTVAYDGAWSSGLTPDVRFQSHRVVLNGRVQVTDGMQLLVRDNYFLRLPNANQPLNPRLDSNDVGAMLQWRQSERSVSTFDYANSTREAELAGVFSQSQLSHGLTFTQLYRLKPELSLEGSAAAQYGRVQVTGVDSHALGQNVGSAVTWTPKPWGMDASARASATVGVVERQGRPLDLQWGGGVGGGLARSVGAFRFDGGYAVNYARGGVTLQGWTLGQQARVGCWATIWEELSASLQLQAVALRRRDALLGDGYSRDISVIAESRWRVHALKLAAGITDGLPQGLTNPSGGDGLFLAPEFNAHSRYLTLTYEGSLLDRLSVMVIGRLATIESPGQPPRAEQALAAQALYVLGRFSFSLEYRLDYHLADTGWGRTHSLFARVTRSFAFF